MKTVFKKNLILSFIFLTVFPVASFAENIKTYCNALDGVQGKILVQIDQKKKDFLSRQDATLKEIISKKKSYSTDILSGRGKGDDAMTEYFKLLDEKATTKEETQAIVAFKRSVRTAKKNERSSLDQILKQFYSDIDLKIKDRSDGIVDTFHSFSLSMKNAFSKAKKECVAKHPDDTIKQNIIKDIHDARVVFESLVKTYTLRSDIDRRIEERNTAIQKIRDTYLSASAQAKDKLPESIKSL